MSSEASQNSRTFRDQLGREIILSHAPKRIVSLVPSQTEFIAALGLTNELVGITKFCIHPEDVFKSKPRIGGTKDFSIDKIKALSPDIIICNKEENDKRKIQELAKYFPVYVSDVLDLESAYEMMQHLGEICEKSTEAKHIIANCRSEFEQLAIHLEGKKPVKTLYLIWENPYMAAGSGNFINEILEKARFENMLQNHSSRYPILSENEIISMAPEVIMLSSEPYPFKGKHIAQLKQILPNTKFMLVDGEMFSWYGSRLLKVPEYLLEHVIDYSRRK
jgi:ABC-type Fe3+-hydroxamate transport system substrate-binding protein